MSDPYRTGRSLPRIAPPASLGRRVRAWFDGTLRRWRISRFITRATLRELEAAQFGGGQLARAICRARVAHIQAIVGVREGAPVSAALRRAWKLADLDAQIVDLDARLQRMQEQTILRNPSPRLPPQPSPPLHPLKSLPE